MKTESAFDHIKHVQPGQDQIVFEDVRKYVYNELKLYDRVKLESIVAKKCNDLVSGKIIAKCFYPERDKKGSRTFIRNYRILVIFNSYSKYPISKKMPTATLADQNNVYRYITEKVVFSDCKELVLFFLMREVFAFLRHSRQIEGRLTGPGANKYALGHLKKFRKQNA